ncbi:MAG: hypothetical protein OEW67_13270 [Cyclobacteriaceae bacterium]|nr:hypothetical protein [Cyclobacteriaceae bacterium]
MNYDWLLRQVFSVLVRLIPAIIGLWFWYRYTKGEKAFIILLGYDVIGIIIGAFLAYYYHNNIVMSHIYAIMEVWLLSIFYQKYMTSKSVKQILSWFPFIYTVFSIVMIIGFTGVFNNNPSSNSIRALFTIVFGSIALTQIVTEDENLIHQGNFWIILGLVSYYLLNIGYLSMKYWLIKTDSTLTWGLFTILRYSFYVVNIFYALGLWLIAKERKQKIVTEDIVST